MDLGHAHVLYICNNLFDTGAALKDLCISHLLLNGQIKHNKRQGKSLTFYLIYFTQCKNSFEKTVKTRMIGPKVNHNVATQQ